MRNVNLQLVILLFISFTATCFAQHADTARFNDASKRSEAAGEILSSLLPLLPKDVVAKAVGVGVFRCKKIDLLLEHAILCPGVISGRTQSAWSAPGFFRLISGGAGRPGR